jgi:signal peptide peptidase SppA
MKLLDVLCAPWAIQPEKLQELQAIYATHLRGDKIDIAGVEQRLGRPLANEPKRYEIQQGVAIVGVDGVMAKRANMFMQVSGGVSTAMVARDVRDAGADPAVHSIILAIDSPGGAADGLELLVSAIRDVRAAGKPVVAHADGAMMSGAYWTGSAAAQIFIADGITHVGSIGVVATHRDLSAAQEKAGVKFTDVYAGKYKRIASENVPLSKEGRQSIQDRVDYIYSVFVADVARHRGVSVDTVLSDMADGRVFVGQQAIDAGLVDGVSTLDALVQQLNDDRRAGAAQAKPTASTPLPAGATPMDRTQLEAQHPDLFKALVAEFTSAGAAAERARIQAVEAACLPGHEALVAALKYDGKTTGGDAALAVMAAERQARSSAAAALANDAPAPVKPAATPAVDKPAAGDDMSLTVEERCKAKWDSDASVRSEFTTLAAYTAYTKAHEAGNVRVLGARRA